MVADNSSKEMTKIMISTHSFVRHLPEFGFYMAVCLIIIYIIYIIICYNIYIIIDLEMY